MIPPPKPSPATLSPPILPSWIFDRPASEGPDAAAFSSGAALSLLHLVLHDPSLGVPGDLLRSRLALRAAVQCRKIEGRGGNEAQLRDAYLLARPGDARGPDGDMLAFWRAGTALSLRSPGWQSRLGAALPDSLQAELPAWLDAAESGRGSPVAPAIRILATVLQAFPRQEAGALLCADVVLARSLGWDWPLPLFGPSLDRTILRAAGAGEEIGSACHAAIARAAREAVRMAHDLARRAARLRAVAPRLRSRGSDDAVHLFLSEEAVFPATMLTPIIRGSTTSMGGRSARRLCDRLIALGVVRELTGRATFRLYGMA
ncbi:MAG: DUF1403 family protein [Jannaschia sp.]